MYSTGSIAHKKTNTNEHIFNHNHHQLRNSAHCTCQALRLMHTLAGDTLSNMLGTRLMSVSTLGAIKIHKKCTAHGILSLSIIDVLMAFANTHSQMCLLVL